MISISLFPSVELVRDWFSTPERDDQKKITPDFALLSKRAA
jgi:hypothetical protein